MLALVHQLVVEQDMQSIGLRLEVHCLKVLQHLLMVLEQEAQLKPDNDSANFEFRLHLLLLEIQLH
jgi:regulator of PEP synthase PpsR (kinase-PPPase family)